MNERTDRHDTHVRRIALGLGALLVAAALLAPAPARADRGRHHDARRGRGHARAAVVVPGPGGPVRSARASVRLRSRGHAPRGAWRRHEGAWTRGHRFAPPHAVRRHRLAYRHAFRRHCSERHARARGPAFGPSVEVTWRWRSLR